VTAKRKPEPRINEAWIEQRLGERKYKQLRMHLTGALRLLGELASENNAAETASASTSPDVKSETMTAMATLAERLRALPRQKRAITIHDIPHVKRKQPRKTR
jgi:hypothetical protein